MSDVNRYDQLVSRIRGAANALEQRAHALKLQELEDDELSVPNKADLLSFTAQQVALLAVLRSIEQGDDSWLVKQIESVN